METFTHFLSAIDFTPVLIQVFPAIMNPLSHGFQSLFVVLFTSLKNILLLHPGLISGTFLISMVYIIYSLAEKPKKKVIPVTESNKIL